MLQRQRTLGMLLAATAIASSVAAASFGVVEGTVSTRAGQPVGGALVLPVSLDRPARAVPEIASYTGADGRYAWHLPPGRYRLIVRIEDRKPVAGIVVVKSDISAKMNFQLE